MGLDGGRHDRLNEVRELVKGLKAMDGMLLRAISLMRYRVLEIFASGFTRICRHVRQRLLLFVQRRVGTGCNPSTNRGLCDWLLLCSMFVVYPHPRLRSFLVIASAEKGCNKCKPSLESALSRMIEGLFVVFFPYMLAPV